MKDLTKISKFLPTSASKGEPENIPNILKLLLLVKLLHYDLFAKYCYQFWKTFLEKLWIQLDLDANCLMKLLLPSVYTFNAINKYWNVWFVAMNFKSELFYCLISCDRTDRVYLIIIFWICLMFDLSCLQNLGT